MTALAQIAPPQSELTPTPALQALELDGPDPNGREDKPLYRKIAQLPRILRDRINSMLDESRTYAEIIQTLNQSTNPPLPYSISETNLSRWKARGYQRAGRSRRNLY